MLKDHQQNIQLNEFIDIILDENKRNPSYITNKSIDRFPGLIKDVGYKRILQIADDEILTHVWIGSNRTKSSLHFDYYDNYLAQVVGEKKVIMVSPDDTKYLYQYSSNIDKSKVDPFIPDLVKYPNYSRVTSWCSTLNKGDILFIPKQWWHALLSTEPSISVNRFFGPRSNVSDLVPMLYAGGPSAWAAFIKDFIFHGLLRVKFKQRLYTAEPIGVWYYNQVSFYLRKKIWNKSLR